MKNNQTAGIKSGTLNETNFDICSYPDNVRKLSCTTKSILSNETEFKTTMEQLTPLKEASNTKKLLTTNSLLSNPSDSLLFSSLNDSCSLTSSPLTAQQYKKVVVPKLTSPMKISFDDLAIDLNADKSSPSKLLSSLSINSKSLLLNEIDNQSCPDGNVLRKVASITAGSLGIRPTNEFFTTNSSSGSENLNTNNNNIQKNDTKLNFKSLLNGSKFDLKSLEKFEG